ncbi:MAG TPA: hypothetical protein VLR26_06115 [Frankiaceae bacterium]|nr:hypothetical protein [Frankiaceae bacterium]
MTALVIVEGLALVLLAVLVAGLLRSHAEILKRLHELGAGLEPDGGHERAGHEHAAHEAADLGFPVPPGRALPSARGARPAADVSGETATGEIAHIAVTGTGRDTVLAFLSTGCRTCAGLWSTVGDGSKLGLPADTSLIIVTRSSDEESFGRIRELAPVSTPVVLSTDAWDAYEVPVAPYFVHVDGDAGTVIGEGAASSWQQVSELLRDATADRKTSAARGATLSRRRLLGGGVLAGNAESVDLTDLGSARREERIDAELRAAGIEPGDSSLYLGKDSLYAATPDQP